MINAMAKEEVVLSRYHCVRSQHPRSSSERLPHFDRLALSLTMASVAFESDWAAVLPQIIQSAVGRKLRIHPSD
jgi:hypothetical protein